MLEPAGEAPGAAHRSERLQKIFDVLGDYVHPNYGNHRLLVRPYSIEAANVIVESFVAVYEAFLLLPWVGDTDGTPDGHTREERRPFEVLAETTVPELARACGADTQVAPWSNAIASFRRQLQLEDLLNADAKVIENGSVPQVDLEFGVGAIRALRKCRVPPEAWPVPISTAAERLRYTLLVRDEEQLIAGVARLGTVPGKRDDAITWLQLMCSALTFSINITEFKLDMLGCQAARALNAENVVGAALVVRSMLEHHAVAIALGKKLGALWEQIERKAPSDHQVATILGEAEKQVARVLAASPESQEQSAPWRTLWQGSVRRYHVLDPVNALDADQPGYLKTYSLLSHIVHGTACTGGDLLGERGLVPARGQLAQLALFLAELCKPESMLDRQAASMIVAHRLALSALDPTVGLGSRVANMRLLEGQKLKPGRDINGSGTQEDPFRFRRGLLYHDAYGHWLKQHGVQVRK